jgi:hypothetical protein
MTSRSRTVSIVLVMLVGLVGWQWSRERKIAECLNDNGIWDGPRSICVPARGGPILMRDLRRT